MENGRTSFFYGFLLKDRPRLVRMTIVTKPDYVDIEKDDKRLRLRLYSTVSRKTWLYLPHKGAKITALNCRNNEPSLTTNAKTFERNYVLLSHPCPIFFFFLFSPFNQI